MNFIFALSIEIPGLKDAVKAMLHHIQGKHEISPFYDADALESAVPGISAGIQTVAMTVLSIMAILEFTSAIARYGGDTSMGLKVISFTMFKISLLATIAKKGTSIAHDIIGEGHALLLSVKQSTEVHDMGQGSADALVDNASTGELFGAMIMLMIPWLLAWVPFIAMKVVLAVVDIQVYLLASFAALPLAFLTHSETRSIAISYLKKLFALAITPVVVFALIAMFNALTEPIEMGGDSLFGWIGGNFIDLVAAPILLTVLIVSSSSLANKIFGD